MYIEITEVRAVPIIITVTLQFATVCWIRSNFHKISLLHYGHFPKKVTFLILTNSSYICYYLKPPTMAISQECMTTTIMISQQP